MRAQSKKNIKKLKAYLAAQKPKVNVHLQSNK